MAKEKTALNSEVTEIVDALVLISITSEMLAKKIVSYSLKNNKEGQTNGKRKLQTNL